MDGGRVFRCLLCCAVMAWAMPVGADSSSSTKAAGHRTITGVVLSERSGLLTVKTEEGSQLNLAASASHRHGHAIPKIGDKVTITLDENNSVIDVHPKDQGGVHNFVTGQLEYVGKMKKEIKLRTPEGEKTFPLERLEMKSGGIEEGAMVTAEVNEAGTVIDLHRTNQ